MLREESPFAPREVPYYPRGYTEAAELEPRLGFTASQPVEPPESSAPAESGEGILNALTCVRGPGASGSRKHESVTAQSDGAAVPTRGFSCTYCLCALETSAGRRSQSGSRLRTALLSGFPASRHQARERAP